MRAAWFDVRSDNRTGNTVGHLIWCLHLITCPSSADFAYFLDVWAGFLQVHAFFCHLMSCKNISKAPFLKKIFFKADHNQQHTL